MRAHLMERLQQGDSDACRLLLDDIGPASYPFPAHARRNRRSRGRLPGSLHGAFPGAPHLRGRPSARAMALRDRAQRRGRPLAAALGARGWEELTADLPDRAEGDSPAPLPDIEALLTRLPPAQREAFAMLKLDGMTLEAAAGRAGVSVGAFKVRAHRAYKALRKLIGGEGG